MVNEMLRWMENLRAPFVATTNLADRLDPATQRRFTVQVTFKPLAQGQARALFVSHFGLAPPANLRAIEGLTPGDFAVVHRRAQLLGESRAGVLAEWLSAEVSLRGNSPRPVGFRIAEPLMCAPNCEDRTRPLVPDKRMATEREAFAHVR